jgi:adhesin transport system outer membrane protein
MIFNKKNIFNYCLVLSLLLASHLILSDINTKIYDLSMDESRHKAFINDMAEALTQHPEALLQSSLVKQQINQVKIVKSELKPTMYFQANSKSPPLDSETDSVFQSLQQKNGSVIDQTLVVEQLITDFGQTRNRVFQQEEVLNANKSIRLLEKSKLALRMLDGCFNTAVFALLLEASDSSVVRHKEITNLIEIRVDSGRAPGRELSRSLARLAEAKAKKLLIASNLSEAESKFNSLLPTKQICKKFPVTKFLIQSEDSDALKTAKAENEEIKSARFKIKSLERQLRSIQKGKYPLISAELRADKYDISNSEDYNLVGAVKLNWNIYQGKKRRIQEQNTREQIRAATYEAMVLERNLESSVISNLAELNQSSQKLKAFQEAYEANSTSREQLRAQFFAANISLLELLQSERDYLEAAESLILNTKQVRMSEHLHLFYTGQLNSYLDLNI